MSGRAKIDKHVSRSLAWVGLASSLVGILDFLAILIILKYWIPPEQYGIATKAVWIFPILDYATDLGLSSAVVQKEEADPETVSTVFWINLALGTALFAVIALTAPFIAVEFYGHAIIGWMLITYGTKLVWQNVYFVPAALMRRELRFRELSIIRILANVAEFGAKIGFAATGFGIWCFVAGPLARVAVTGIGCQLRHPWRPRFVFQLRKTWSHVAFGVRTAGSQILLQFYTNVDYPIVGYFFGDHALGVYRMAYEIVLEPVKTISYVVQDIAFPTFSRLRHEPPKLIEQFVALTRLNLVFVMTYSAIVFVVANDLIAAAFPKFAGAGLAVRILCAVAVLRAVSYVMPPLLDGMGHPERTFRYTLTASVALPLSYIAGAVVLGPVLGFESVAVAWAIGYPIAFGVLLWLALTTIDLPARRFVRQVIGIPACTIAAIALGFGVELLGAALPLGVRLVATVAVMLVAIGLLLAYTQGLSVRAAIKSLKG